MGTQITHDRWGRGEATDAVFQRRFRLGAAFVWRLAMVAVACRMVLVLVVGQWGPASSVPLHIAAALTVLAAISIERVGRVITVRVDAAGMVLKRHCAATRYYAWCSIEGAERTQDGLIIRSSRSQDLVPADCSNIDRLEELVVCTLMGLAESVPITLSAPEPGRHSSSRAEVSEAISGDVPGRWIPHRVSWAVGLLLFAAAGACNMVAVVLASSPMRLLAVGWQALVFGVLAIWQLRGARGVLATRPWGLAIEIGASTPEQRLVTSIATVDMEPGRAVRIEFSDGMFLPDRRLDAERFRDAVRRATEARRTRLEAWRVGTEWEVRRN